MIDTLESIIKPIALGKQDFLFIGASGTGKTYAAEHLNPPVLFLNTEGGLRTVASSGTGSSREIDVREFDKPFTELITKVIPAIIDQEEFNTICVDSITGLSELFLREVAGINPDPRRTLPNYGTAIDRLRQVVSKLKSAKANVIFTATEIAIENDAGTIECYIPNVAGKETFARQLPAYMDQVWFFIIKEERTTKMINGKPQTEVSIERKILAAPTGKRVGKDRDGVLSVENEIDFEDLRRKLKLIKEG